MRNQGRDGSPQVDPNHGETGQTGHETGHGSLRGRLRRVLSDGLKGLAHGVLADEIDRLTAQRDQWCAEATSRARRDGMKRAYVDGIMAELQAAVAKRDALQGEVERLKRDLHDAKAGRGVAETESRNFRAERDDLHDTIEAAHLALADALEDDCDTVLDGIAALVADRAEAKAATDRWKRVHDAQLGAKTRALRENAELRAGLREIANNRHHGVRVGGVGGCKDNCPTCIAVEALRLADAAGAARDTEPTGQQVVTSDGRLADVCYDGLVRAEQPRPKHEATTCAGCGARLPILGPVDEEVTCECPGCGAEVTFGPVPGFSGWESMIVVAKEG